jgi:hypothetical protein
VTAFQFGVRVAAPRRDEPDGWEPIVGAPAAGEPVVLAPLVRGRFADAVVEGGVSSRRALVYSDREAANLAAAVVTAVLDLEHDGLDCLAAVPDDDLVTLGVIAHRLGLAPRAARGLVLDGPAPVLRCGGERVFRWSDLAVRLPSAPDPTPEPVLAALNVALRLRRLIRGDPALADAVRGLMTA